MDEVIYSVACRGDQNKHEPGHGGWYGQPGDKCPHCGREVHVTGTIGVIDMSSAR